ncbi:MAG TPA: hypothetical protein VLC53_17580 [Myxococcota bacterium]|nr:hypothetical protein [Myxococcota bacterium]
MAPLRVLLLLLLASSVAGCRGPDDGWPESWLDRLSDPSEAPAGRHWTVSPDRLEELFRTGKGLVRDSTPLSSGVTGADRFTVYFPALGRSVRVKWKAAPAGDADGWNNAPRKELAAYELQKWFLPASAYVVPTTVARCIALEDYGRLDSSAKPTLPDSRCVLGVQSLWLARVEVPETLYDEARFRSEPLYARHLANFNLLTYLIQHRDTRKGNVLTARNPRNRRVFAVDNGISFDGIVHNPLQNQWQHIQVPALPRDSIERLRAVTRERAGELATVAQFRLDGDGVLQPEEPVPPLDPSGGSRYRDGVLQLGLTESEIDNVWKRLQDLLRRVDAGALPLF